MDIADYARFLAALLFVLGLIALVAWLARRSRLAGGPAGGDRRLAVVEVLALDARRRLVLVRRDAVEHLLLLGPERDLVIEAGRATAGAGASSGAGPTTGPGDGALAPGREKG